MRSRRVSSNYPERVAERRYHGFGARTPDGSTKRGRTRGAIKAFKEEMQFIQGDSFTAYGKTIPLAPVRQENEKALERVGAKFAKAGCKQEP